MNEVDRILRKYRFRKGNRERMKKFIDSIVRNNQAETAEEVGVDPHTISSWKDKLGQMSEEERAFLIYNLMDEKYRVQSASD